MEITFPMFPVAVERHPVMGARHGATRMESPREVATDESEINEDVLF